MQPNLQWKKPFAGLGERSQKVTTAAWKSFNFPAEAHEAFEAAERFGVREDILQAAAERFNAAQQAR